METWLDTGYKKMLKKPEDFIVEEVIDAKFLRKFCYKNGKVQKIKGKYGLFKLEKINRNTEDVIKEIVKLTGNQDIGYAGLKDKRAITTQYITIKNQDKDIEKLKIKNVKLSFVKKTDKHISIGDLTGNKFTITLHGIKNKEMVEEKLLIIKKGFVNFFGPQRFGLNQDNHLDGKRILKNELRVEKNRAKFFIHAYQAFIFNKAVEKYSAKDIEVNIIGYDFSKPNNVIEKEMIRLAEKDGISKKDFRIDKLRLMCRGSKRMSRVRPEKLKWSFNRNLKLEFILPKGCYATSLIQQII